MRGALLYLYLSVDVGAAKSWHGTLWTTWTLSWPLLLSAAPASDSGCKRRQRRLLLHAHRGSAMRAATLEVRLVGLGVLRSYSMPRVFNDNS